MLVISSRKIAAVVVATHEDENSDDGYGRVWSQYSMQFKPRDECTGHE